MNGVAHDHFGMAGTTPQICADALFTQLECAELLSGKTMQGVDVDWITGLPIAQY